MLANFLGKSKPINFIVLLLIFVCAFFLNNFQTLSPGDFSLNSIVGNVGMFLVFILLFFIVNFIISKNNLTLGNSYALLFYLLGISFISSYLFDYELVVSYSVHLFFLRKIYSLKTLKDVFKKLFDAGFWLGIMCLFNPYLIVFSALILVALIVHKRIRFQTVVIPLIGLSVPVCLFFAYSFWFDQMEQFTNKFVLYTTYDFSLYTENSFLVPLLLLSLFLIFAIFMKTGRALYVNNSFKKSWILLLTHLLISLSYLIFTFQRNGAELLFAAFPVAIILANGFELIGREFLKEVILFLLITASILAPLSL